MRVLYDFLDLLAMTNSQNIALLIEYLGTSFFGFQRQVPTCRTVQGELEAKLSKFAHHPIEIITAGRIGFTYK